MVQVVERWEEAGSDTRYLTLKVYRKEPDGPVLGYVLPVNLIDENGKTVAFVGTQKDRPVAEAYEKAIALAEEHGVSHLWVHDMDKLFPPDQRPPIAKAA